MRQVIEGKVYDTETASSICDISPADRGDFQWETTWLYRSPEGAFFIAGEGGARSRWAEPLGQSGSGYGSGLRLITEAEARTLCEKHLPAQDYIKVFGEVEEG